MKFRRQLRKAKKVREKVTDAVADKAAELNPLKPDEPMSLENVPTITDESIAEHREEVLSGARKYIYPLQHSKHRILVITGLIAVIVVLSFAVYCTLALYRYYQYNTFLYRVTQVIPFPIARTSRTFIDYENYLFEVRRYVHYYETQQKNLFGGEQQVNNYRKQALESVTTNAYIKILAKKNNVSVSDKEVDRRITIVRDQNRLGANNKVFADVLRDYWGWSVSDFRRNLKDHMLGEKIEAKLDTEAQAKANLVFKQVKDGTDFGALAKRYSDDPATRDGGGDYGIQITKTNPNIPPEVIDQLFKLQPGAYSEPFLASRLDINRPDTLEIVKILSNNGSAVTAQHISINLKDSSIYVNELKKQQPIKTYVHF